MIVATGHEMDVVRALAGELARVGELFGQGRER